MDVTDEASEGDDGLIFWAFFIRPYLLSLGRVDVNGTVFSKLSNGISYLKAEALGALIGFGPACT